MSKDYKIRLVKAFATGMVLSGLFALLAGKVVVSIGLLLLGFLTWIVGTTVIWYSK